MKKISLRIRKQYFDAIVRGEKTIELRQYKDYWVNRLLMGDFPKEAVFVCGKNVHRREIIDVTVGTPESYLGRQLSEQGEKDIPSVFCIGIQLGTEIKQGAF